MHAPPLRLMILATPRSGNTWLRHLLRDAFALEEVAVHRPDDLVWEHLPQRLVVQLHWKRTLELEALLDRHHFHLIGIQRHPLDTLVSILHVSRHDVQSECWLDGEGGDESGIVAAMPRSDAFLDYACGSRALALFRVNLDWHDHPRRFHLTYEELLSHPLDTLTKVERWLDQPSSTSLEEVIRRNQLGELRRRHHGNRHFWQGQAGLWRTLLPKAEAQRIAWVHRTSFDRFGYACDPDDELTGLAADRNWIALIADECKQINQEALLARSEAARLREQSCKDRAQTEAAIRQTELVNAEADHLREAIQRSEHSIEQLLLEKTSLENRVATEEEQLRQVRADQERTSGQLEDAMQLLIEQAKTLTDVAEELASAQELVRSMTTQIESYQRLGTRPLALMRRWAEFRDRHPRLVGLLKRVTR